MKEEETKQAPTGVDKNGGSGDADSERQLREPAAAYLVEAPTEQVSQGAPAGALQFDAQSTLQTASDEPGQAVLDPFMEAVEVVLFRHGKAWKALAK